MKKSTKVILPFVSLMIIATLFIAPIITAQFDGGFGFVDGGFDLGSGFDSGFDVGSGFDSGFDVGSGFDGGFDVGDGSGFDGGFDVGDGSGFDGGFDVGDGSGFDGGFPLVGDTGSIPGDDGGFDPGFGPGGPGSGDGDTFPPPGFNQPARWNTLTDKSIFQASRDFTLVYKQLATECVDPDDAEVVSITSTHSQFKLAFIGFDLVIFDLNASFTGTEKVMLSCNNVDASFDLHVVPRSSGTPPSTITDDDDGELSIFISSIRIPDAYDAEAGMQVPVTIAFKNNGDDKLENVEAAVVIQDLSVRGSVGPFDLSEGKTVSKTMLIELPEDVVPGTYYVRVTVDSGSVHRVVHRDIEVLE